VSKILFILQSDIRRSLVNSVPSIHCSCDQRL